ncbi:hypothetical protein K1T71_002800 [Dendrolimus kikuchii]|uniref:Uncharacterized protein n=1 Tax=Dendrolimus kikuchii TaxID=765133 RepID=A0ACC1DDP1_9NEOP|nr:hypothetical protein K1T71_002800 [Dendrolimus kikuchii]
MFVKIGLFVIMSITATLAIAPALMLTPLIKANQSEQARKLSIVDPSYFLNVTSHSGFLTIDEKYGSNTFFWYFPVMGKPVNKTPWIIWLQGGPGASSIAGLFDEIGPFQFKDGILKKREWSWASNYSLLFIDNPVGAGYSFTNSPDGFIQDMDVCGTHLYIALRQFLMIFPELQKVPLFIAGESYAGRYLPSFALKIKEQDNKVGPLDVNFQGIMMGNPVLNRDSIADYTSVFQQWGLIDMQAAQAMRKLQENYTRALEKNRPEEAYNLRNVLLDKLSELSMQYQLFNLLEDSIDSEVKSFINYIEQPDIKEAIHAGNIKFSFSNYTVHIKLIPDFIEDVAPKVTDLLEHYRILIYCGQLDLTTPCVLNAQSRRRKWHWNGRDQFLNAPRNPWWYNNTVAGYVKSGGRLTEVLVRGAGHLAPMDKPAEVLNLISSFIRGYDMPVPPNYITQPEFTPEYKPDNIKVAGNIQADASTGANVGLIVSILLNVILIIAIALGVVFYLKWKKNHELFLYNNMEETGVAESVLSLS